MHDHHASSHATGRAIAERGAGFAARLACAIFRLPLSGADVPVQVTFNLTPEGEAWRRNFAGAVFQSKLRERIVDSQRLLAESFGPLGFDFELKAGNLGLSMHFKGWRLLGIPLPRGIAPGIRATETANQGRFCFDVSVAFPWGSPIIHYRGWLAPRH